MSNLFDLGYAWTYLFWAIVFLAGFIAFKMNKTYVAYEGYERVRRNNSLRFRISMFLLFGTFAILPGMLAVSLADSIAFDKVKVDASWSRNIETLSDGQGVKGRFFLGSGQINNSPAYMYYLEEDDGFHLYSVYAYKSRITYTDETPKMVVHFKKSGNLFWSRHFGNSDDYEDYREYEFQVPRGSIQQQYVLDAQ